MTGFGEFIGANLGANGGTLGKTESSISSGAVVPSVYARLLSAQTTPRCE